MKITSKRSANDAYDVMKKATKALIDNGFTPKSAMRIVLEQFLKEIKG